MLFDIDKLYRSKVYVREFSYFVSGLDIQLEKAEYDSPVRRKIGRRWRNTTTHVPVFPLILIRSNGLVVKTGCRESGSLGSIPDVLKRSAAPWPF